MRVIIDTPGAPTKNQPNQAGTFRGGLAPTMEASSDNQADTGAGSSSVML